MVATIDNHTFKGMRMDELMTHPKDRELIDDEECCCLEIVSHKVPKEHRDPRGYFDVLWWSLEGGSGTIYKLNFNTSSVFAMELSNFDCDDDEEEEEEDEET
jgi:hypothetical protein